MWLRVATLLLEKRSTWLIILKKKTQKKTLLWWTHAFLTACMWHVNLQPTQHKRFKVWESQESPLEIASGVVNYIKRNKDFFCWGDWRQLADFLPAPLSMVCTDPTPHLWSRFSFRVLGTARGKIPKIYRWEPNPLLVSGWPSPEATILLPRDDHIQPSCTQNVKVCCEP